jgi:hypothetical protein
MMCRFVAWRQARPFSTAWIVLGETSARFARSFWVHPRACRAARMRFMGAGLGVRGALFDCARIAPGRRSGARDLLQLVDSLGGFSSPNCESIPEHNRPRRRPPGCRCGDRCSFLGTVLAPPVGAESGGGRRVWTPGIPCGTRLSSACGKPPAASTWRIRPPRTRWIQPDPSGRRHVLPTFVHLLGTSKAHVG